MMEKKFDVVVVGAGPAGMFATYELLEKKPDIKIGLIDMGPMVEDRNGDDVMSGFGGAGTYSDGKLQFTPKLSHERTFHLISVEKYQQILDYIDEIFMGFGVKAIEYPKNKEEVAVLVAEAERKGIELVVRRAKHVGTNLLKEVIHKIQDYFLSRKVELIMNTKITDLLEENGRGDWSN